LSTVFSTFFFGLQKGTGFRWPWPNTIIDWCIKRGIKKTEKGSKNFEISKANRRFGKKITSGNAKRWHFVELIEGTVTERGAKNLQ